MDLRAYYARIRSIEEELHEDSVVIVSRATSDGGRAEVKNEVPKAVAARMVADEKAELASERDAAEYRAAIEKKWRG
jgi:hypothetical protein